MTNYEKLIDNIRNQHKPFIVYDVETTGVMNGNDNRITQIALAAYGYENGKYELKDKIFMLAKADKDVLNNILAKESLNPENIRQVAVEDFKSNLRLQAKQDVKNCQAKIDRRRDKVACMTTEQSLRYPEKVEKLNRECKELEAELKQLKDRAEKLEESLDFEKYPLNELNNNAPCFSSFELDRQVTVNDYWDMAEQKIRDSVKLSEILNLQGINLKEYIKSDTGLSSQEMQTGITEFLKKYKTDNTVFINNGTYFAKHYLDKQNILIATDKDTVIDLTQAQRTMVGGATSWTADIATFAENYKKLTKNEIKVFDAFTKALCLAEITSAATSIKLTNKSLDYLENAVKEEAYRIDEGYVMSRARAQSLNWFTTDHPVNADFHFHELKFVNFGDDRRYVDLDKMFEVNNNFEVTLEGHKEPIKTWEELEAKIKALNSDISPELLQQIKDKFEEVSKTAETERLAASAALEDERDADLSLSDDYEAEEETETFTTEETKTLSVIEMGKLALEQNFKAFGELLDRMAESKANLEKKRDEADKDYNEFEKEKIFPLLEGYQEIYKKAKDSGFGLSEKLAFKHDETMYTININNFMKYKTTYIETSWGERLKNDYIRKNSILRDKDGFMESLIKAINDDIVRYIERATARTQQYNADFKALDYNDREEDEPER